jgi:hypothetical protein
VAGQLFCAQGAFASGGEPHRIHQIISIIRMSMEKENFPHDESDFDRLCKSKKAEGWHCMGQERLTRTRLSKDVKFEEFPLQMEEEIRARYLETVKKQDPTSEFEVELLLDENTEKLRRLREILPVEEYRDILGKLKDGDKSFLVWVRRIEKSKTIKNRS